MRAKRKSWWYLLAGTGGAVVCAGLGVVGVVALTRSRAGATADPASSSASGAAPAHLTFAANPLPDPIPTDAEAYLQWRLRKARPDLMQVPPATAAPVASASAGLLPMPHRPYLPPAVVTREPAPPSTRLYALRPRPALDVPPLPTVPVALPAPPALPDFPLARVVSPDPAQVPPASVGAQSTPDRPDVIDDPTVNRVAPPALTTTAPPRDAPAPSVAAAAPDAQRPRDAVAPPDDRLEIDPGIALPDPPTQPTLPAGK